MSEQTPLRLTSVAEITPVLTMARVSTISYGHERFYDFLTQVYTHAQLGIQATTLSDEGYGRSGREMTKQVLLMMGDPGNGKTFIDRTVEHEIVPRLDNELALFQGSLFQRHVKKRNWEEDGEKPAIANGNILTPVDQPFERHELHFAEDELTKAIVKDINDPFSAIVQVELPGGIAAQIDDQMKVYRPFGPRIVRQLVEKQGPFAHLTYDVWGAVFVGGPFLRSKRQGRDSIRKAKNLEEAEKVAKLYGIIKKDATLSPEYWELSKNGAYMDQFVVIDKCVGELMSDIDHLPSIIEAKRLADSYQHDELSRLLMANSGEPAYMHHYVQAARWQHFLEEAIRLDPARAFIGYYNPTPSQSGLDKDDILKLKETLANR